MSSVNPSSLIAASVTSSEAGIAISTTIALRHERRKNSITMPVKIDRLDQRAHHAGQLLLGVGRLDVEDRELHVGIRAAQTGQCGEHVLRGLDLARVGRLLDVQLDHGMPLEYAKTRCVS